MQLDRMKNENPDKEEEDDDDGECARASLGKCGVREVARYSIRGPCDRATNNKATAANICPIDSYVKCDKTGW